MNITVLGAGAIGSLWAYKLSQAGHTVSVWTKSSEESRYPIQLDENAEIVLPANSKESLGNSDLILITVKAWQVKEAILPLIQDIHPDTILLLMHNGMGAVDEIKQQLADFPVVLATTTQAAYKPEKSHVLHTGKGTTQLGAFNDKGNHCQFLAEVLNHALAEVIWNDNIYHALWNKLAINCAINPLTAIHQIKNGQLSDAAFQDQLEEIVAEVAKVMSQEKVLTSKEELLGSVQKVINATAENNSSMQQDILHKRRSEIDYINGYLCRVAGKHLIATPQNNKLYQQIKDIEQGWKL
ncbi:2-dehydropantoate 2-reductase [Vibrio sp. JC009]|uniref:2-dehydropantoate 2-reductase n=1 Tax=Vibrio sp. JC009 TaxID=2912314 RepID=UPI0023B0F37D|nr:2-dehydropantoate 2-reductase [Vibrio sp. JC009]WED22442.1 2-dehydropantoate 2-reductase [Vibrio sp. JC009]